PSLLIALSLHDALPILGPLIVPLVVVPSPQSMVAEYSTPVELGSGSVNVATVPLNSWPSVALKVVPCPVICCSAAATQVLDAVADRKSTRLNSSHGSSL